MKTNKTMTLRAAAAFAALGSSCYAGSIGSEKYVYDSSGNIIVKVIDGKVTRMTYDGANRIVGSQIPGQSGTRTTFDDAGRPVEVETGPGSQTRHIDYGYGDKVIATKSPTVDAEFFYNAEGQMVGKKVAGKVSSYSWDGNVLSSDAEMAFTNEEHVSGGVPVLSGEDVVVSDYLGSTLASGNSLFVGTAFGEGLENGRFTGKPFVKELESYVFLHRNYSPETLRWTSKDPLGFPDGANSYAFVNGDPLTNLDVYGLMTVSGLLGPLPAAGPYSKTIGAKTFTYTVTFTAYEGTCANGTTKATLWMNPQITPVGMTMTAAEKADVALYYTSNCHGYTVGVGAWINSGGAGYGSNDIEAILKGEGYKTTEDKDNKATVVTYGSVSHSAKVASYASGKVATITHKDNDLTKVATTVAVGGTTYGAVAKYWEK